MKKFLIGLVIAVLGTWIPYHFFGIGKNTPAIQNDAPITNTIQTVNQSGGTNTLVTVTSPIPIVYATSSLSLNTKLGNFYEHRYEVTVSNPISKMEIVPINSKVKIWNVKSQFRSSGIRTPLGPSFPYEIREVSFFTDKEIKPEDLSFGVK